MEKILTWLFQMLSFLINTLLSWKLIGNFSFLHLVIGVFILTAIIKLITFGFKKED